MNSKLQSSKTSKNKKPSATFNATSSERVFVSGKTGSGKSTFCHLMLYTVKNLVVVDSKDGLENWNLQECTVENVEKFKKGEPIRLRVVHNDDAFELLQIAYKRQNCIVYIDEITALIPKPSSFPPIITDIWTRGRSRNVGGWGVTQRPVSIPKIFMSEAEHIVTFRLTLEQDRKTVAGFAGKEVLTPPIDKYGFWLYNVESGKPVYRSGLKAT